MCGIVALTAGILGGVEAQAQAGASPDSLIRNPQQGATPRPIDPSPALPPAAPLAPLPAAPIATTFDVGPPPRGLPAPSGDPLKIVAADDPILRLALTAAPRATFDAAIGAAVARNPAIGESIAQREEAEAARNEARARQYPVADVSLSSFQVLSRAFSNDPQNLLERSRPSARTDYTVRIQQPVVDFGASNGRIRAGNARLEAAIAGIEDSSTQVALRAIAAWYNVHGYRALVGLGEAFAASQTELRVAIRERVRSGVAAPADVAQVESYIASANTQLAQFRRSLANAEAQYVELIGSPAPPDLGRAPPPDLAGVSPDRFDQGADQIAAVRAARSGADAARQDVKAVHGEILPSLTVGVDGGRYGVLETERDYDIRGNVTLSMRIGGGATQRLAQARARARGAEARLARIRQETKRDAAIAWSDVQALEDARAAIETNYIASRQSRDVLAERFRVARGTLFDLLGAESNYFGVAARYIETVTELDTARYALLARTGKLLGALSIDPKGLDPKGHTR